MYYCTMPVPDRGGGGGWGGGAGGTYGNVLVMFGVVWGISRP